MGISSPCIAHCSTGLGDNVCRGCGRTFIEVANWSVLDPEAQQAVLERLPARRQLQRVAAAWGGLVDVAQRADGEWGAVRVHGRTVWLRRIDAGWSVECDGRSSQVADEAEALQRAVAQCPEGAAGGNGSVFD
jgi:predicted Fe-S protein YdhL (DUF1289 family)